MRDVVFAARQFRRHPWLPIAIVVSLGAAMGISTSLFSIVNGIWFAPWRVPAASELRIIQPAVSVDEWRAMADGAPAFSRLAGWSLTVTRGSDASPVYVELVTPNYFDVLNVPMALGRAFAGGTEAGSRDTVLGYPFWRSHFASDPGVIGKTITLVPPDRAFEGPREGDTLTIVGVASQDFHGTDAFHGDVWRLVDSALPIKLSVFGRLSKTTSDARAQRELASVHQRFVAAGNQAPATLTLTRTDRFSQSPEMRISDLWNSTFAGVLFITIVACLNVTNLLLALGHSRRGEIALRLALGATRARVIRQLMTETLLLCLLAGAVGLAVAAWLPGALLARVAPPGSRTAELFVPVIDQHVFLWSLVVSVLASVAFGLMPAMRVTEGGIGGEVKDGQSNSRRALMPVLLSAQTIVSTMALAIAVFILRSDSARHASALDASPAGLSALVAAGFGGVAVVLGAIGYFSMLEYLVGQRTREIGIRRALGAQAADVIQTVAVRSAVPVFRGLLIGGIGAAVIGVVLQRAQLPEGVRPFDVLPYAATAAALLTSTAVAAFWPTRRALRIEPQQALRHD